MRYKPENDAGFWTFFFLVWIPICVLLYSIAGSQP